MEIHIRDTWRRSAPRSARGRAGLALGSLAWLPAVMLSLPLCSLLAGALYHSAGDPRVGSGALGGMLANHLRLLVEFYGGAAALLTAAPGGVALTLAWYVTRREGEAAIAWGLALLSAPVLLVLVPLTLFSLEARNFPAPAAALLCCLVGMVGAGPAAMWCAARHMRRPGAPAKEAVLWTAAAGVIVLALLYALTSTGLGSPPLAEALAGLYAATWQGP